jgi:exopolysaccharide biosynthesis WecB/TagA/CpsF family protein
MSSGLVAFYMHDLSGGGVERMRLALIAEFRARGVRTCLIVGRKQGALIDLLPADLDVVELGCAGTVRSVRKLGRVLRRLRPRILLVSLDHNNVTALLAGAWAPGTQVVICQHNALSAEARSGWKYRMIPFLYWLLQRRAAGIIAVSQGVADDLADTARIARKRITPIYNPVIGADFAARMADEVRHPWFGDGGAPVCVFVGRLTAQKDPGLLLQAIAFLAAVRDLRLLVLGEGPLLGGLRVQAQVLGLAGIVDFVGFQANPLPWIREAACLVSTSRYEGLGNVLIEALACGTPVVATDCPHGPAEILVGGEVGSLVPVGDPVALASALARVLNSPPQADQLRRRAGAFTAASCAEAHMALFAELGARPAARHGFGLHFSSLSAEAVAQRLMERAPSWGPNLVVTPNIDHVRLLRRPAFAAACRGARLVCPDGFPVLAYARLRGLKVAGRVTGCEIFSLLAEHAALPSKRLVVVVESLPTERAVLSWARRLGLTRVHVIAAPLRLERDLAAQVRLAEAIRLTAPDILVMTLGAPVSEVFVHEHRERLPSCWALCVGQAVRVHLGLVQRAPDLWQRAGLEWLWRIGQEPRRLVGRYARAALWFPVAVAVDMLRVGQGHKEAPKALV